ncbi:MAG: DUF4330 domain-containing protein, partial [Ruminiclostridium sp.]|nr:DUF4330 domain-containing protein [Ruminiclostridium sp.]
MNVGLCAAGVAAADEGKHFHGDSSEKKTCEIQHNIIQWFGKMVKLRRLLMSIIDNKGKLFGKINIIDLIAVVLILAVVALLG